MRRVLEIFFACILFTACSPRVVTKVEYRYEHDTIVRVDVRDSIVERIVEKRDSSSRVEKGDTITLEFWHWERDYRYEKILQSKIDSLSSVRRDSIPYPVEVPVYVEKPLKEWQKGMIGVGIFSILAFILVVIIKIKGL